MSIKYVISRCDSYFTLGVSYCSHRVYSLYHKKYTLVNTSKQKNVHFYQKLCNKGKELFGLFILIPIFRALTNLSDYYFTCRQILKLPMSPFHKAHSFLRAVFTLLLITGLRIEFTFYNSIASFFNHVLGFY